MSNTLVGFKLCLNESDDVNEYIYVLCRTLMPRKNKKLKLRCLSMMAMMRISLSLSHPALFKYHRADAETTIQSSKEHRSLSMQVLRTQLGLMMAHG